ncbi:MAG: tyrosine-type recombinase/integrase [Planctomycetes bacterium]|nr:tyrosine-type recombinase/integrase [Planctomycetota bacterium]MBL7042030.1 tyrosine-type recombinase/integrase [Pirellulaceae bacterium]
MPRKYKLTWQPGSGRNPGRWRKKYKRKAYYFSGGRGKSDRQAYETALAEWERLKLTIDAALPKPHQAHYERAIREWEAVLTWCRKHPGDDEMAHTAVEKLDRLRRQFAAVKPIPVPREDTFEAHFDRQPCPPEFAEIFAKLDSLEFPGAPPDESVYSDVIDPSKHDFLQKLDPSDPGQERSRIWRDRLDVMNRSATPEDQTVGVYVEQFIAKKKASASAGQLTAGRVYALRLHLTHFRDWVGSEFNVVDIKGKHLDDYHEALLEDVGAKKWSGTTAADRLGSVKTFVRWLWQIEAMPSLPRNMDRDSQALKIVKTLPTIVTFTKQEIATLLPEASDRTKLYILLMLNCGMTQKDISDLDLSEVNWDAGRITRKRSKTKNHENVPIVDYPLWPETLRLLRQERCKRRSGRVLLNEKGNPLWYEEVGDGGKLKKNDNVKSAFDRLKRKTGIEKPLKSLKKTSASLLRDNPKYTSLEDLFLGHAPQSMSDKHYAKAPQSLFDDAIAWLGTEFDIAATEDDSEQS